ncbi:tellurite resistance protein TerC [Flaviramulus basaltis]|uniref:Tellurite resistance protein TerC n=1 Tax=Flaviramulus basaltis TaxID=369401 RepID=A0A1K2II36_9FLAO|nr:TerC/Alx family metal homeostasis membrane protein [Flaviramulus basaltis]SFZ91896.1 tellurite resistance protein TerC [Flaviramulus basaltis]
MIIWVIFISFILLFLALDLGVFNKTPHIISTKEASIWTLIWISIALCFSLLIFIIFKNDWVDNPTNLTPVDASLKYITGYLIELSLSIDNIFVIAVIFSSFKIPQKHQHRVLFWGIIGAIVFRALMIFFGVTLFIKFEWITYLFGIFLIFTAIKLFFSKEDNEFNPKKGFLYRVLGKIIPISSTVESEYFFIRKKHLLVATPLFLVLILIEFTDVLFAFDSIPAILAITTNPFIVFSSNILAILGLRSMYFFLSNMTSKFIYIKYSLVAILSFVGVKLLLSHSYKFPEWVSLTFIFFALFLGVLVSLKSKKNIKDD